MIDLHTVTIEGPDLSGKTTLYNNLHTRSKFTWNIQDRGELSMLCYARLYNRDTVDDWRAKLHSHLNNLNNHIIILLPNWDVLQGRYQRRGDEIQDLTSLSKLHAIFCEEAQLLQNLTTVTVLDEIRDPDEMTNICLIELGDRVSMDIWGVGDSVYKHVLGSGDNERSPVRFVLTTDGTFPGADVGIMSHPPETEYYCKILSGVINNIVLEMSGVNEQNIRQVPDTTRRFIFTQNSCISLIHTMIRGDNLRVSAFCRSSDVEKTFGYDLAFLYYLMSEVHARLELASNIKCSLEVTLNSAHIIVPQPSYTEL